MPLMSAQEKRRIKLKKREDLKKRKEERLAKQKADAAREAARLAARAASGGNDEEPNSLSVIQAILRGPILSPKGVLLQSPLNKITPADSPGIIMCYGDEWNGEAIIEYTQTVMLYLPGWLSNENLKALPILNTHLS